MERGITTLGIIVTGFFFLLALCVKSDYAWGGIVGIVIAWFGLYLWNE